LVAFAQTLTNIPYKYGSIDPAQGFDCSGFVTYVFNHFGIQVPRSSVDFDDPAAHTVPLNEARPGDLILFTGTDSTKKVVGHMGIIISNPNEGLRFIHSTSGKADGVTETPLNPYYQGRFMRAIRVFNQNDSL
jgi:cell wall-associated NlpC family hydrolase